MGNPEPWGRGDERQTQVRLSRGFWLAKTECTQKVWRQVMGTTPSHFHGDDLPVEQISWYDCHNFIDRLEQPGRGWRFALPTEAQWEYACRAGSARDYGGLEAMAWHGGNSGGQTHPVGTKQANAWGLQDMHGNVCEWCQDAYNIFLPGGTDPEIKNGAERVFRGGSSLHLLNACGSGNRDKFRPSYQSQTVGFRLAAVPSGE